MNAPEGHCARNLGGLLSPPTSSVPDATAQLATTLALGRARQAKQSVRDGDRATGLQMLALAVAALGVAPGAKPRPPLRATAALVSVPILWGTYAPVAKTLLLETNAPATLSNFATHGVGAISLLSLLAVQRATRGKAAPETSSASRGRTLRASCELGTYP